MQCRYKRKTCLRSFPPCSSHCGTSTHVPKYRLGIPAQSGIHHKRGRKSRHHYYEYCSSQPGERLTCLPWAWSELKHHQHHPYLCSQSSPDLRCMGTHEYRQSMSRFLPTSGTLVDRGPCPISIGQRKAMRPSDLIVLIACFSPKE